MRAKPRWLCLLFGIRLVLQAMSFGADPVWFWIVATAVVFITGISKSGLAGGAGVLAVPLLGLVISPTHAAGLLLPLLLFMDGLSVRAWWGEQDNPRLVLLIPGAVIGVGLGALGFGLLPVEWIRLIVGGIAVSFALLQISPSQTRSRTSWQAWLWGTLSGITSTVAHAGAPPLNAYLLGERLSRRSYLATAVMFFATLNLLKLPAYLILGNLNLASLAITLILAPVAWLGVRAGLLLQGRIPDRWFFRAVAILLGLTGMRLITQAVPAILPG